MMIRTFAVAVCLLSATIAAQDTVSPGRFEVASIKRSEFTPGDRFLSTPGITAPGGRWSAQNTTLAQLVRTLYDVRPEQIVGAPAWFDTDLFVIMAKAEDPDASRDQLVTMARQLLADRFRLRHHVEQRPFDVHAMVVARRDGQFGPGLRRSPCDNLPRDARGVPSAPSSPSAERPRCGAFSRTVVGDLSRFRFSGHTLRTQLMLHRVEAVIGTPVIDRTGLTGTFDIDLEYVPDTVAWRPPLGASAAAEAKASGPSLLTAMEDQLGLKFERRRELLEVIVIDSVESPTPD